MNKVILIGRLTKDPEIKNTASQVSVCRFTVAVDRKYKDSNGQRQADFINCVAWRQTANFISQYFHKGSKIAVTGSIQTRTYENQQGQRQYVTEVVVEEAEFVESASNSRQQGGNGYGNNNYNYNQAPSAPVAEPTYAPSAPTAPNKPIAPDLNMGFGGSNDSFDLPFPIDDDTGSITF